jgi:prepilin-type N-terminal cleavage/methylation domain-containing protein
MDSLPFRNCCICVRSAFSLVELLVVIAIIAVLAALLATGVSASRARARTVGCIVNLRQIWTGVMQYAEDNQGFLKPPYPGAIEDINIPYGLYLSAPLMCCPAEEPEAGMHLWFSNGLGYVHYASFSHFGLDVSYNVDAKAFHGPWGVRACLPERVMVFGEGMPPSYGYHWFHRVACPWNISARFRHAGKLSTRCMNIVLATGEMMMWDQRDIPDPSDPAKPPEPALQ